DKLIVILSQHSVKSSWVEYEVKATLKNVEAVARSTTKPCSHTNEKEGLVYRLAQKHPGSEC
ncbi:MAG: hypothetical protein ACJ8DI_08770, partial [Ktedonobacteraceae bacterium]